MSRDGSAKLTHALKDVRMRWDDTKEQWKDSVRENFEKNHLSPMQDAAALAARGMDDLAEVMGRMKRECE